MTRAVAILLALAACKTRAAIPDDPRPLLALAPVAPAALCVTKGALAGALIRVPTFRAIANGTRGDAVKLAFTYRGESADTRALASGQIRRQLGLKLRAVNGCNLVYVMWRLDPRPTLEVSIKLNPGKRTHKECGADGYTKLVPVRHTAVPALETGSSHTLHAEIAGDVLSAWIDDSLAWVGELPSEARALSGPAGIRTDNVNVEITELSAPTSDSSGSPADQPKCGGSDAEDEP